MAWGNDTAATQLTAVTTEQFFDVYIAVPINGYVHCQVIGNSSGNTDNLVIAAYSTLDDSSENWDTVPFFQVELDCTDGNDNDRSFTIHDVYKFRVGVRREDNGSTDTFTADLSYRVATP